MAGDPRTVLIANPGADLYGSDRMAVETAKALVDAGFRVVVTVPGPGPLIGHMTDVGGTVIEQPTPII
ncbi:MAG TPA: glycosyl transferase, partial [Arachnia sp.]|nr:glycosyl transferase [Arachnia sp.]